MVVKPQEILADIERRQGAIARQLEDKIDAELKREFKGPNSVEVDAFMFWNRLKSENKKLLIEKYTSVGWEVTGNNKTDSSGREGHYLSFKYTKPTEAK